MLAAGPYQRFSMLGARAWWVGGSRGQPGGDMGEEEVDTARSCSTRWPSAHEHHTVTCQGRRRRPAVSVASHPCQAVELAVLWNVLASKEPEDGGGGRSAGKSKARQAQRLDGADGGHKSTGGRLLGSCQNCALQCHASGDTAALCEVSECRATSVSQAQPRLRRRHTCREVVVRFCASRHCKTVSTTLNRRIALHLRLFDP